MRSRATTSVGVLGLTGLLAACSIGGSDSSSSTLAPIESTVFVTIPTTSTTLSPAGSAAPEGGTLGGEIVYEVVAGDYWQAIAQKYGCANYLEIIAYNDNKESIFPGDKIKIPATCGQNPTESTAAGGSNQPKPATTTTAPADGSATYTIVAGDTLSGIARKFNTTMGSIITLNGWSDGIDHVLIPGRDIKVPGA